MPIDKKMLFYIRRNHADLELNLSDCSLSDSDYKLLAEALEKNSYIQRIVPKEALPIDNKYVARIQQLLASNRQQADGSIGVRLEQATASLQQNLVPKIASTEDRSSALWYSPIKNITDSIIELEAKQQIAPVSADTLFEKAQDLYAKEQWHEALDQLHKILEITSTTKDIKNIELSQVYYQIACCYVYSQTSASQQQSELIKKANQMFENALQQEDLKYNTSATRIHCDYGQFLYRQENYQAACQQALMVIDNLAKARWLSYQGVAQSLLLVEIRDVLQKMHRQEITDRVIAYTLLLKSYLKQELIVKNFGYLANFAGEVYQGIDPSGYRMLAYCYQQFGQMEKAQQALDDSELALKELELAKIIQTRQEELNKLELKKYYLFVFKKK